MLAVRPMQRLQEDVDMDEENELRTLEGVSPGVESRLAFAIPVSTVQHASGYLPNATSEN